MNYALKNVKRSTGNYKIMIKYVLHLINVVNNLSICLLHLKIWVNVLKNAKKIVYITLMWVIMKINAQMLKIVLIIILIICIFKCLMKNNVLWVVKIKFQLYKMIKLIVFMIIQHVEILIYIIQMVYVFQNVKKYTK